MKARRGFSLIVAVALLAGCMTPGKYRALTPEQRAVWDAHQAALLRGASASLNGLPAHHADIAAQLHKQAAELDDWRASIVTPMHTPDAAPRPAATPTAAATPSRRLPDPLAPASVGGPNPGITCPAGMSAERCREEAAEAVLEWQAKAMANVEASAAAMAALETPGAHP